MRRIAILGLAALVAVAVAAVAYAQQVNTYTVKGDVTPRKAGTPSKPTTVGVDFNYSVGEQSGNRPSPVKHYSIRFEGLRVNTNRWPSCDAALINRNGGKIDKCPKGSQVGKGYIENATGASSNVADRSIKCNASVTVFNVRGGKAALAIQGSPNSSDSRTRCDIELAQAIPAVYRKRGAFMALEFTVPSLLLHPLPGLDNAVQNVRSNITRQSKRFKGKRVGYYESVGGCKRGKRRIEVVFTPEKGERKTGKTTAKCS
jgi:hypothetical protein